MTSQSSSPLLKKLEPYIEKLDKELHKDNQLTKLLAEVEKKTGVKRLQIALGFISLFMIVFLLTFGSELLLEAVSFAYPAYKSIKAVESKQTDDDTQWLIYWVVYSYISFCEFFIDIILWWFPFYFTTKLIILLWCMAPIKQNGATFIYTHLIKPFMDKYGAEIEKGEREIRMAVDDINSEVTKSVSDNLRQRVQESVQNVDVNGLMSQAAEDYKSA